MKNLDAVLICLHLVWPSKKIISIKRRIGSLTFSNFICFSSDELMLSMKDWANTAKLSFLDFIGLRSIINHLKCKLIIVNYILAWSASNCNVFFCIYLDIFRITFFLLYHRSMYLFVQIFDKALWCNFPGYCLQISFWIQTSEVAPYTNYIFKRRFVKIKLYLMSKLLRILLYCFKCNKFLWKWAVTSSGYQQINIWLAVIVWNQLLLWKFNFFSRNFRNILFRHFNVF